jgi:ADP-ribosylglycohydrolase
VVGAARVVSAGGKILRAMGLAIAVANSELTDAIGHHALSCSATLSDGVCAPAAHAVGRLVGRAPASSRFNVCILRMRLRYLCRQSARSRVAVHS